MKISRIHHAAYRCKDAKETVEWYAKNLNMDFVLAIADIVFNENWRPWHRAMGDRGVHYI